MTRDAINTLFKLNRNAAPILEDYQSVIMKYEAAEWHCWKQNWQSKTKQMNLKWEREFFPAIKDTRSYKIQQRDKMRHILLLLSVQAIQLSSTFDLPQPLDNFYDEVVRFYKRLRQEGGKFVQNMVGFILLIDIRNDR